MAVIGVLVAIERRRTYKGLDIQVKPIYASIAKGPGLVIRDPCIVLRTKRTPEELSEILGDVGGLQVVVRRVATTNREEHFLAVGLTRLDASADGWAVRKQS